MPDYIDTDQLKRNILSDMRVELAEEFDRNFERKAFFTLPPHSKKAREHTFHIRHAPFKIIVKIVKTDSTQRSIQPLRLQPLT